MAKKYMNIDKLVPDPQILEIAGREFDISKSSARTTSTLLKVGSDNASAKGDPSKSYEVYMAEMGALIGALGEDQHGETASLEWVLDNVNTAQFKTIVEFIGDCLSGAEETVPEGEVPANFTPNRAQKRAKK